MMGTFVFILIVLVATTVAFWAFVLKSDQTLRLLSKLTMRQTLPSNGELGMEATDLDSVRKTEKENRRIARDNNRR